QRDRRRCRGLLAGVRAQARRPRTGRGPMSGRLPQLVLALAAAGACASSNAMWSARQVANEARALEAEGRASDAAAAWARAAVKAESAAARHPGGPLVDEALTLQGEALARIGSCDVAEAPLRRVLEGGSDGTLRERAALVLAQCALDAGDPAAAERALVVPLESRDRGRRSRAAYLAGRAAGGGAAPIRAGRTGGSRLGGGTAGPPAARARDGEPRGTPGRARCGGAPPDGAAAVGTGRAGGRGGACLPGDGAARARA